MKVISLLVVIILFLQSCNRNNEQKTVSIGHKGIDSLKTIIALKEKSLKEYYSHLMDKSISVDSLPNNLINGLVKEYQVFVNLYPKDSLSPIYIDKTHQLFTQAKQYSYAVDWIDTLLLHYPNYKNKTLVLYSAATTTDMYLMDTNRVKKYYTRMLNECPKLKSEIKKQIHLRLKHLSIPYMDYLVKQNSLK